MRRLLALLLAFPLVALVPDAGAQVPITFRVQMDVQAERGAFDPAFDSVDIAGSFNDWGSPVTPLADPDGDLTYEVTLGGFTPGQALEYKFRYNGTWDGTEEFPGVGNNRRYTVLPADNVITVWYNDEAPATGPPTAVFTGPRVLSEGGLAAFRDRSTGAVSARAWTFEGGTPTSSTDAEPVVRYAEPGTYDVALTVTGPEGDDTLVIEDYVEVRARDLSQLRWWNDTVFYEVFVRSFYDSDGDGIGDFRGLTEKLDYLNDGDPTTTDDLGVTGLWLMPIHDSPSYHGYDVVDYRSVHPDYGTMDDVRAFLDAAQARGIRVVIDYVMNHSSTQHPWFRASSQSVPAYADFYRWSATDPGSNGPLGDPWHRAARGYYYGVFWSGMPDLNFEAQAVRDSMYAAADFWLEEVGVDGFRLDAVKYLVEEDGVAEDAPGTFAVWNEFSAHITETDPEAFTVCEAWSGTPYVVPYITEGGLSTCFDFDLAGQILHAARTGDATGAIRQMQTVYDAYPHLQVATFLTNHDQNRVMDQVSRDPSKARVASSFYLTLPGVPFVYYGEEVAMLGTKPDPDIRRPMQWSADPYGGFSTRTPWHPLNSNYPDWNVAQQTDDPTSLLSHYRRLIHARNASPALRRGAYFGAPASSGSVMAFVRETDEETVLVLINANEAPQRNVTVTLPPGTLAPGEWVVTDLLVPEAEEPFVTITSGNAIANIELGGHEARVLRFLNPVDAEGEAPAPSFGLAAPYPNPATNRVQLAFTLDGSAEETVQVEVYDLLGRRVQTLLDGPLALGPHTAVLDAEAMAAGTYLVRLRHGAQQATQRLVVAR
ncbi:MAG: alpha-amylase family glycosyl hydrolase [Bacteroidota bacterium]